MKKILSLSGAIVIFTSSLSTTACTFADNKASIYKKEIEKIADFASVASRDLVLSTINNISPTYEWNKVAKKGEAKKYFPKYANAFPTGYSVYNVINSTFNTNNEKTALPSNPNQTNLNLNGKRSPLNSSLLDVFSYIYQGVTILSSKFDVGTSDTIEGLLNSFGSGLAGSVDGVIKTVDKDGNYGKDFLNSLKDAFQAIGTGYYTKTDGNNAKVFQGWNYNQCNKIIFIILSNFLNAISKNPKTFIPIDFDSSSATKIADLNAKVATAKTNIANSIKDILNKNTKSITEAIISPYGASSLIYIIGFLGNYISQFDSTLLTKNPSQQTQGLFNDWTNKYKILTENYVPNTNISLQNMAKYIKLFFSVDSKNDPEGYNTLKLFNILFYNAQTFNLVANQLPQIGPKGDDELKNGFTGFTTELFLSAIKGAIDKLIPSSMSKYKGIINAIIGPVGTQVLDIVYKWLYDTSTNTNNGKGIETFILKFVDNPVLKDIISLLKKFGSSIPIIKKILAAIDGLHILAKNVFGAPDYRPWSSLYNGNFITQFLNWLNEYEPIHVQTKTSFKNLKTIFSNNLATLLKALGIKITSTLYFLNNESISSFASSIAKEFDVKDIYANKSTLNEYNLNSTYLSGIFKWLGQTASTSIQTIRANQKKGQQTFNIKLNNAGDLTKISTLDAVLYCLDTNNYLSDSAGAKNAITMLGRPASNSNTPEKFVTNSTFANVEALYGTGNTSGISKLVQLLGDGAKAVENGMYNNEKVNFDKYNLASQWKYDNITSWNNIDKTSKIQYSFIQFKLHYLDPDTNHWNNFNIILRNLSTDYGKWSFYLFKKI